MLLWSAFRLGLEQVLRLLEGLMYVLHIHFEKDTVVHEALQRHRHGLDFADALPHLAAADCGAMLNCDGGLISGVERLGLELVVRAT